MKIAKALNYGIIAAVIASALSFFIKILPCKVGQTTTSTDLAWSLCKLPNPFSEQVAKTTTKFFGLSTDPLAALVFTFLTILIIVFLILNMSKKKGKIIDLTKK